MPSIPDWSWALEEVVGIVAVGLLVALCLALGIIDWDGVGMKNQSTGHNFALGKLSWFGKEMQKAVEVGLGRKVVGCRSWSKEIQ